MSVTLADPISTVSRLGGYALADEALRVMEAMDAGGELEDWLAGFCRGLGFDYFSYVLSRPTDLDRVPAHQPMFITSYPVPWRARYDRQAYHRLDAVVTTGRASRRPFFWGGGEYLSRLSPDRRRLFKEAGDFGIASGFTVPVHGPMGECGLFSIAGAGSMGDFEQTVARSSQLLQALAARVHAMVAEQLLGHAEAAPVSLTEHERVCLDWTMRGKTAWETAKILGRSKPTVDFHIQKAIRKLGAANKLHAAFKALQAGML